MDDQKEVVDKRYEEDPFKGKTCPLVNGECLREKCLSYKVFESEWDDTVLGDERGDVDGVEVTKTVETITGKRYKGKIHECGLGVFGRLVTDVNIVSESSHDIDMEEVARKSGIVLLDKHKKEKEG